MRLTFEGDWDTVLVHLGAAEQELFSCKQRMEALGMTQGSFHATLGQGEAYVHGYVLPTGLEAMHIVTGPGVSPVTAVDFFDPRTPDFLSGYLVDGHFIDVGDEKRVKDFRPSVSARALHREEVPSTPARVRRLTVLPGDIAGLNAGAQIAQAALIRPTMYSGTMRKVVQFILGMGKQYADESIYDAAEPPLPSEIVEGAEDDGTEGDDHETPYESTVKSQGARLYYDHRFMRTHGITRAADGRRWLVEISAARGVLMMPLPLCRYTDLPEFREKCETLGDNEALQVLDLFGGFPSGQSFPADVAAIEAGVRSGRILRPATSDQLDGFYALSAYSSIMGWAFSDSGAEAHNTGYRFDDVGYVRGGHYAIQMSIGAFVDVEPDDAAELLKAAVAEAGGRTDDLRAEIEWKIDRLTQMQVDDFIESLDTDGPDAVFDAIDALTLTPSASSTASVSSSSEGYLFSRATYGSQIKFPEPILSGCVSAPMRPLDNNLPAVDCDTTMHVFFIGDQLKWAKFFVRHGPSASRVVADTIAGREDIPVGDFYREQHSGEFGVLPTFYTNDFDARVERGASIAATTYRRRDAGYYEVIGSTIGVGDRVGDSIDRSFSPPIPANFVATAPIIWRNAKFAYQEWRVTRHNHSQRTAITIPLEDRCSYYYTIEDGNSGGGDMYLFRYEVISDPNVGWYNWSDTSGFKVEALSTSSSVGSEIWPNHQERIDFADHGEWLTVGQDVRTISTRASINLNVYAFSTNVLVPPRFTLDCYFLCDSNLSPVTVFNLSKTGSDFYPTRWFWVSPEPSSGFVDYINSTHNAMGDATSLVYSPDINPSSYEVIGTPADTVMRRSVPTFIGPFDA